MIDSHNSIHEPRSVFLLALSAGLAYYDRQLEKFAEQMAPFLRDIIHTVQPSLKKAMTKSVDNSEEKPDAHI
jgi:hypothetical protein